MVRDLSAAAELRVAAETMKLGDPRFWGSADGVDEALVADLVTASLHNHARTVACTEVRRCVGRQRTSAHVHVGRAVAASDYQETHHHPKRDQVMRTIPDATE